jgi:hypothetical protein
MNPNHSVRIPLLSKILRSPPTLSPIGLHIVIASFANPPLNFHPPHNSSPSSNTIIILYITSSKTLPLPYPIQYDLITHQLITSPRIIPSLILFSLRTSLVKYLSRIRNLNPILLVIIRVELRQ